MRNKRILTITEVAALLNVSPHTVIAWYNSGLLKGFIPGIRARRFTVNDIEKFLAKHDVPLNRIQKEPFFL